MHQNLICIANLEPEQISKYKRIFVYTHFLQDFFDKFYNYLSPNTILISHNSDDGVISKYLPYLEGNKISRWYCQNMEVLHPKLFAIPIGLANSQWPHGNQSVIKSIREQNYTKEYLVYKNFNVHTNYIERTICNNITTQNGIPFSSSLPNDRYWETLAKSVFTISPPGNGIDCHRIWEALYLRTVPVVKSHIAFSQFVNLPILQVPSWDIVTPEYLRHKINEYQYADWNVLDMIEIDYWNKLICTE